jgi:hypothetical protein
MKINLSRLSILRGFALFELLISIIALVISLWTQSEIGRTALFGYSWTRLFIAGLFLAATAGSAWLSIIVWRRSGSEKIVRGIEKLLARSNLRLALWIFLLLIFTSSTLLVYLLYLTRGTPYTHFYQRLTPLALWLALSTLAACIALTLWRGEIPRLRLQTIAWVMLILIAGISVYFSLWQRKSAIFQDVFFMHREGNRLLELKNPYARVLKGDMVQNEKYATLFPLSYELSAVVQSLGLHDFTLWLQFWQIVFLISYLGLALLIFYIPYQASLTALALFGAFFMLFNRWSLELITIHDIDFIPILLLVGSLALLPKHRGLSFLLFGASLAFKQIAIFLLPVYLIWAWQLGDRRLSWKFALDLLWIAIIPALTSLPFLAWNWEGFVKSVLFSATRRSYAPNDVLSLDALMGWAGLPGKLPMLALMLLIYIFAWTKKLKPFTAGLLTLATFVAFNSVLFESYLVWLMPFIPLAAYEVSVSISSRSNSE